MLTLDLGALVVSIFYRFQRTDKGNIWKHVILVALALYHVFLVFSTQC